MTYQQQILANAENIQKIFTYIKKVGGFPLVTTGLELTDLMAIQREDQTLSAKISDLPFATIQQIYGLHALIKGGYRNVIGTYDFFIWVKEYIINGTYTDYYRSATRTPEPADPDWDRFDAAVINTAGEIFIRKGTAGEFFIEPEIDNATELKIALIYIKAGSVVPSDINEIVVFNEGIGSAGGEFNINYLSGTLSLEQSSSGAKSIKLVNKQAVMATSAVNFEGSEMSNMTFKVYLATSTKNALRFSLWIGGTTRVGEVYINHGEFDFNAFLIGQWQTVTVPSLAFRYQSQAWGNVQYNELWINNNKSGSTVYIDEISFQTGLLPPTTSPNSHEHTNLNFLETLSQLVLDLKEDKINKGVANGYTPLNALTKVAATYLDIVNDLTTGGTTALLSAQQGVVLKSQIDAINTLLTSDNINLDTVQEIVDAIETVQTSLSTILVNDLTTGGVTKALTAEQGKVLKGLVDALTTVVSGKEDTSNKSQDIEADKLSTTKYGSIKAIYDWAKGLFIQDAPSDTKTYGRKDAGWVEVVGGGGADLSGEIQLPAYPNTRNDGQLTVNRVLTTDANGFLKLQTIAIGQAPFISSITPNFGIPNSTSSINIKGSFFTTTMTISATGHIVNYFNFISSNEIEVNITRGNLEGDFNITIDNGIITTLTDGLLISIGTVFKPLTAEWTLTEPIDVDNDKVLVGTYNAVGVAIWSKEFDFTKDWILRWSYNNTPLGTALRVMETVMSLINVSNSANKIGTSVATGVTYFNFCRVEDGVRNSSIVYHYNVGDFNTCIASLKSNNVIFEWRYLSEILYLYVNNTLYYTYLVTITENLKLRVATKSYDIENIKYIELAT